MVVYLLLATLIIITLLFSNTEHFTINSYNETLPITDDNSSDQDKIKLTELFKKTNKQVNIYLIGVLLGILTTDTLKALFAHNIKILLEPKYLQILYRIIAICLIGFGFRLLNVAYKLM